MPLYFEEDVPVNNVDYWENISIVTPSNVPIPSDWIYPIFEEDYILNKQQKIDLKATKQKLINLYQMPSASWEQSLAKKLFDAYHNSHSKGFTPRLDTTETNKDLIGIELELATRASKYKEYLKSSAEYFKSLKEYNNDFFVECDKSIVTGFEIISQPYSFNRFNKEFLPLLSNMLIKLKSFGVETNWPVAALHLHVDRNVFGKDKDTQINNLCKLQWLFSNNNYTIYKWTNFVMHNCGRCESIAFNTYQECLTYIKNIYVDPNTYQPQRKMIINYLNSATVEFRCFNSTTDIELITNIVKFIQYVCKKSNSIEGSPDELSSLEYWFKDCEDKELKEFVLKKEA